MSPVHKDEDEDTKLPLPAQEHALPPQRSQTVQADFDADPDANPDGHSTALPSTSTKATPATPKIPPRVRQLQSSIMKARKQIEETRSKLEETCRTPRLGGRPLAHGVTPGAGDKRATVDEARAVVKAHVEMLTRYNETRDIAMGLLGMIADNQGRRLRDIMEERGIGGGEG